MAKRRSRPQTKQEKIITAVVVIVAVVAVILSATGGMDRLLERFGIRDAVVQPMETQLEMHVIDVGNADSIWLTNQGVNLLIDAGERSAGDTVVSYLRAHGVERLDYVIATHADADHIGGMKTVISSFEVGRYMMSFMDDAHTPTTSTYLNLLDKLDELQIEVEDVKAGKAFSVGDAAVQVLSPTRLYDDNNNQSVVCRVTFGARRFLLMGDAEKEAESDLLANGTDLSADFIKLGHHGSSSSSQEAFLRAVSPRYAVMTCGKDNSYGHPHKEVLERLDKLGITYYRSDRNGTVVARCDGQDITVTTERSDAA